MILLFVTYKDYIIKHNSGIMAYMTIRTIEYLLGRFGSGKSPGSADYVDLIDTLADDRNAVYFASTAPEDTSANPLWFNTSTQVLNIYNNGSWISGSGGETGPAGPQGDPGVDGEDALWNFTGAYNLGASYAIGDVATYNGETWYRIDAHGGNTGDTPSEGSYWTLIAQKGEQGIQGEQGPQGTDIHFVGSVATVNQLPSTGNNINDAYIVDEDGDLYVWDGQLPWHNVGQIVGPQGIQGEPGIQGVQGSDGLDAVYDTDQAVISMQVFG